MDGGDTKFKSEEQLQREYLNNLLKQLEKENSTDETKNGNPSTTKNSLKSKFISKTKRSKSVSHQQPKILYPNFNLLFDHLQKENTTDHQTDLKSSKKSINNQLKIPRINTSFIDVDGCDNALNTVSVNNYKRNKSQDLTAEKSSSIFGNFFRNNIFSKSHQQLPKVSNNQLNQNYSGYNERILFNDLK
jgi:hypothetical protein